MSNHLDNAFPKLAQSKKHLSLANLPTPVSVHRTLTIKRDDVTADDYGGNKVRKLEYLLQQAVDKKASRIATFGTVGSHHAVATALYARHAGFDCTCFLSHQSMQPGLGDALRFHQANGTEVIRYGGARAKRIRTLRDHLQGRHAWAVPIGGSSWVGTLGYVNAGLELAAQIDAGELQQPERIYVALGTMGTVAGLALGFALAGLDIEIHAIRVTIEQVANEAALQRLMRKTARMMRASDPTIASDIADRSHIVMRHGFLGAGYGHSTADAERAIDLARAEFGLTLDMTYTAKAMAAVLQDLDGGYDRPALFWHTFSSQPLSVDHEIEPDYSQIPDEFARYFDDAAAD